jgi:putative FmdB family regulatory protein
MPATRSNSENPNPTNPTNRPEMPLYEYECDNGHRFEVIVKFSDPPLEKCTKCGAPAHKLMSAPAFQLKGTGWYITDYARKDSKDPKDTKKTDDSKGTKETTETKESNQSKDAKAEKAEKAEKTTKTEASSETSKPSKDATPAKSDST